MFEVTHVNYSRSSRVLQDNISEWYAYVFILYRCIVSFAILQVIRYVFIQQTLKVAEKDRDLMIRGKFKAERELKKKLKEIFYFVVKSTNHEAFIDCKTLSDALRQGGIRTWMRAVELDVDDPTALFLLLD